VHPRQLNPYRPPATIALRIRLNGNAPYSAHSSRHDASVPEAPRTGASCELTHAVRAARRDFDTVDWTHPRIR
jgi:hypothetical protein